MIQVMIKQNQNIEFLDIVSTRPMNALPDLLRKALLQLSSTLVPVGLKPTQYKHLMT